MAKKKKNPPQIPLALDNFVFVNTAKQFYSEY